MSKTTFTPGPWAVADGEVHDKGYLVITSKGMGPHTPLARIGGADWDDASRPDAHLIAAAPDLYAALEAIMMIVNGDGISANYRGDTRDLDDAISDARAALSKARGTT